MSSTQRRISLRKAAELIFRTRTPSDEQVGRVLSLISVGELEGNTRGTTAEAVADFIARAAVEGKRTRQTSSGDPRQVDTDQINKVYQNTMKQYFLAVILRRKVAGASRNFQRSVIVGQVVVLLATVGVVFMTARIIVPPDSPEKAAVEQWLENNAERTRVIRIYPPEVDDDGNTRMRVKYHYVASSGRGVDTDRIFTIHAGRVVAVDQPD